MDELFRPVRSVGVAVVTGVEPVPAIRLYTSLAGVEWALQVRGMRSTNAGNSETFMVAMARLSAADLRALREAIDAALADFKEEET